MAKRTLRGLTLIELLIAVTVLCAVLVLIYGAFSSMRTSKQGLQRVQDRYREGRLAMQRMTRELQSAYISLHVPFNTSLAVQRTSFVGTRATPADRIDFNAFSNQRVDKNSHESDQCELSYYGLARTDETGSVDLVRRVSVSPDLEPRKGGRVDVLATDIDLFDLEYLDPATGSWVETWDSVQAAGQPNRLPLQIRIILVLNGGMHRAEGTGRDTLRFVSKIALPMQNPLNFAM